MFPLVVKRYTAAGQYALPETIESFDLPTLTEFDNKLSELLTKYASEENVGIYAPFCTLKVARVNGKVRI